MRTKVKKINIGYSCGCNDARHLDNRTAHRKCGNLRRL